VPEERSDGFEAHTPVDGLGGESMTELVRGDVSDAGLFGEAGKGVSDPESGDGPAVLDEEQVTAQPGGSVIVDPVVKEHF